MSAPEQLSQMRKEMLSAKESAAYWEQEAERERNQRQLEIGMQEYRGNTVSYIYDKERNYGQHFTRMNSEIISLRAHLGRMIARLEDTCPESLTVRTEIDQARSLLNSPTRDPK